MSARGERCHACAAINSWSDSACASVERVRVAAWEQSACNEEAVASGSSISTRIGEKLVTLAANGKKLDALLKDWDPNADGSVTKQEFRICVRKLFETYPETKDVDDLFQSLASDGSYRLLAGVHQRTCTRARTRAPACAEALARKHKPYARESVPSPVHVRY